MIFTFYSYKGGVGRTMALANIAELLYQRGLKVLMVDFDLEAPGLERFFKVPEALYQPNEVIEQRGVIDLLVSYKELRSSPLHKLNSENISEDKFDFPVEPIINFIVPLYEENEQGGSLSILPAGCRGEEKFYEYAQLVHCFDWNDFYAHWNGEDFFEWFRKEVDKYADIVLIDSRTGITEMGGVCTYELADVVVIFVAPNEQNIDGTLKMAQSLSNLELIEKQRKGRNLSLVIVPSRVDNGEKELLDSFQEDFERKLTPFISDKLNFQKSGFVNLKIPYVPFYAFHEKVAVRESEKASASDLSTAYKNLTFTLAQLTSEDHILYISYILEKFDQYLDLSQRTMIISSAVFKNSSYQRVIEASQRLQFIIEDSLNKVFNNSYNDTAIETLLDGQKLNISGIKLREKLEELSKDLIQSYNNTEYGKNPIYLNILRNKNSQLQIRLLRHIWQKYKQYRIPLLSWLYELGSHSNPEIRFKASVAVGELCKYDFVLVREKVLFPWVKCEDQNLQRLAASVLSIQIFDDSLVPQVLELLHHWSTLDNNPRLRWVAAVAYGGYVGLRFPDIAFQDLLFIAQSQDGLLFSDVVQSLINLFEMGQIVPNQYLSVLTALQLWTEDTKKTIPNHLGLLTFWLLMSNAKVTEESNTTHLPTLLWLAKENDLYQEILTCLVRRALNLKTTRLSVLQTIHNWLELVNYDHLLYPTVGQIIYNLVVQGSNNEKKRIITYLNRWATEKPPNDNAAWKILSVLKKHPNIPNIT